MDGTENRDANGDEYESDGDPGVELCTEPDPDWSSGSCGFDTTSAADPVRHPHVVVDDERKKVRTSVDGTTSHSVRRQNVKSSTSK